MHNSNFYFWSPSKYGDMFCTGYWYKGKKSGIILKLKKKEWKLLTVIHSISILDWLSKSLSLKLDLVSLVK